MRKPKCRYCQRDVLYAVVGVKVHDDGTYGPNRLAFDLQPVPTASCQVMAVVLSKSRGLCDVRNVANPPAECHQMHRCPQYQEAVVLEQLDQLRAADAVEAFLNTRPMSPGPTAPARRVRNAS